MHRLDDHDLQLADDEILVFAVIRNESLRLPWFIQYHRNLGIDRFFVVDNGSADGSTDYLLSQVDVHVFYTEASYADAQYGMAWINGLLSTYAPGKWALTVDADELFIYPGFEQVGIRQLTRFLDDHQYDALEAPLIDMYGSQPIKDTHYQPGTDFLAACHYFDGRPMEPNCRDGARKRLFWPEDHSDAKPPYLMKRPLVRWREGLYYKTGAHIIDNVNPANIRGALLHFKMFSDFHEKVSIAVEEGEHWQNASQYVVYRDGIRENPHLSPFYAGSVRFENSQQLVSLGLMRDSGEFAAFRSRV